MGLTPGVAAELIADGGAAGAGDDLFRSPAFLEAEGATHTLRLSGADWSAAVPLRVGEVPGSDRLDAVSPYGYPGGTLAGGGQPPEPGAVDWTPTGLVSIFARERAIGEPWLARPFERGRILLHDPSRPREIRARLAEQIRANERAGWGVQVAPGPRSEPGARDAFALAYEETMVRTGAADRYFFSREYLDRVLGFESSWLLVATRDDGEAGAAAIAGRSDGVLHYFLGGTADAALAASPFKNVVATMLDLADELELPLNLGGGLRAGDGLERFKRGFANAERPFRTQEVVCDREEYERLGARKAAAGWFPAYRAP